MSIQPTERNTSDALQLHTFTQDNVIRKEDNSLAARMTHFKAGGGGIAAIMISIGLVAIIALRAVAQSLAASGAIAISSTSILMVTSPIIIALALGIIILAVS